MRQKRLKVAIIAPPWLSLPVKGYGGIELVLQGLVQALADIPSIEVVLFASGERKLRNVTTYSLFKKDQFEHIYEPYFETYALVRAHLEFAYNTIKEMGDFDIVHDAEYTLMTCRRFIMPIYFSLSSFGTHQHNCTVMERI